MFLKHSKNDCIWASEGEEKEDFEGNNSLLKSNYFSGLIETQGLEGEFVGGIAEALVFK